MTPCLSHLPGIPVSQGDQEERRDTHSAPDSLLSLRNSYIPRDNSLQSETVHYKRGVCQQFCVPSHTVDPSEWSEEEVGPCGINRGVEYGYGRGMKSPSLLHLTKPLLLSLSSWASTWTGRCTPWWYMQWWMKERVRRGFLAGLGFPSCWHHGISLCTNRAEPPASPC